MKPFSFFKALVLNLLFVMPSLSASAAPDCVLFDEQAEFKACFEKGDSPQVLLFFHGLGGNEKSYWNYPGLIRFHQSLAQQKKSPSILSVSYGSDWLLSSVAVNGSTLDVFLLKHLPSILKHWGIQKDQVKFLMGLSMGGFNSFQVFRASDFQFQKIAFLCPAFVTISPHASSQEIESYIKRTKADRRRVLFMRDWSKFEFPTQGEWESHSPIHQMALSSRSQASAQFFVSCGSADEFGFFEGSNLIADILKVSPHSVNWVPVSNGNHCQFSVSELLRFWSGAVR